MPPSKPKGPPRPRTPPAPDPRRKRPDPELPFDVEPLRADDPSPQHVPQFPATSRRAAQVLKDAEVGGRPDGEDDASTSGLPGRGARRVPAREAVDEVSARFAEEELEGLAEPGASAAGLYVERGPGVGQLAPIAEGTLLIGRASSADLRLQHPSISRRHSLLTRKGGRFFLKDLGSQNGTYVNRTRIDREVELFAGDEVIVGTSQLRLRGPAGAAESAPAGPRREPARASPSLLAVAVASGAIGIALATAVLFVVFKVGPESATEVPPVSATAGEKAGAPAPREVAAAEPATAPSRRTAAAAPEADRTTGEDRSSQRGDPPVTPRADGPSQRDAPVTRGAERPERKEPATTRTNRASQREEPMDPAVLARYERGEVDAAIALASGKDLGALAARMKRFQGEHLAGRRALQAGDDATAIRRLEAALTLDEELAGGWGTLNEQLRRELSDAHVLAALRQQRLGDAASARSSLGSALRLDPRNARAKAELDRLSPAKAIDAAFGD